MKFIVNAEAVDEAMDKLCGLGDHLHHMGDEESAKCLGEIERLLKDGIQDHDW